MTNEDEIIARAKLVLEGAEPPGWPVPIAKSLLRDLIAIAEGDDNEPPQEKYVPNPWGPVVDGVMPRGFWGDMNTHRPWSGVPPRGSD